MSKVKLYNFQTNTYNEIVSDALTEEQGLSYIPIGIETVEESYREYIKIGLIPFEAVRMVVYEVLLAFRVALIDQWDESNSQKL